MNPIDTFGKTCLIIAAVIFTAFLIKHAYITKLRRMRDNIDATTPEGKSAIRKLNRKIDRANGYSVKD